MSRARRRGEGSIFLEVYALDQAIGTLLREAMAGGPLTPEEYAVYSVVFEGETVTPTEMSLRMSMPITTVMEKVRLLESRGHARRAAHPRDGRSYQLVLTASGLAAHRQANQRFEVAYRAFLDTLAGDEAHAEAQLARLRGAAERAVKRAVK
jgi:DNA-binding MarR family transcriptional regulator